MGAGWTQSSFCSGGQCVQVAYRRATTCGSGTCVEVAQVDASVLVRDSKHPDGPVLRFSIEEWEAFLLGVEAGEFDLP